jgi:transcriptional antiterminator RfaH
MIRPACNRVSPHWYVVHTKPKQENRAANNLRAWGIETYTPMIRARHSRVHAREQSYLSKPLFPQYIFARFDARNLLPKVYLTRGVHRVVCFGDSPAQVDDEIITVIQLQTGDDGFIRLGDSLKTGDRVMINSGSLKSLVGIFERELKDSDRVVILLTAITFQGHIVIERDRVSKVN